MNLRIEMYEKNCLRVLAAASSEQHCGIKKTHCFIGGKKLKNSIFKKVNTSFVKKMCFVFEYYQGFMLSVLSLNGIDWMA